MYAPSSRKQAHTHYIGCGDLTDPYAIQEFGSHRSPNTLVPVPTVVRSAHGWIRTCLSSSSGLMEGAGGVRVLVWGQKVVQVSE